jgi:hypothetical protein
MWLRCWETFMVILVAYSAWVYPFEVAFMNASPKGGLEVTDMVVDLFFAIDIVLTFFVAYIDSSTQLLVRDRKRITHRYVTYTMPTCVRTILHYSFSSSFFELHDDIHPYHIAIYAAYQLQNNLCCAVRVTHAAMLHCLILLYKHFHTSLLSFCLS